MVIVSGVESSDHFYNHLCLIKFIQNQLLFVISGTSLGTTIFSIIIKINKLFWYRLKFFYRVLNCCSSEMDFTRNIQWSVVLFTVNTLIFCPCPRWHVLLPRHDVHIFLYDNIAPGKEVWFLLSCKFCCCCIILCLFAKTLNVYKVAFYSSLRGLNTQLSFSRN